MEWALDPHPANGYTNRALKTHVNEAAEPVDFDIHADLVAITFHTPSAAHAYSLAARFRRQGRTVALGGPHVTLLPDEAQAHADVIFIGEAEHNWPQFLTEFEAGRFRSRYQSAAPPSLAVCSVQVARPVMRHAFGGPEHRLVDWVMLRRSEDGTFGVAFRRVVPEPVLARLVAPDDSMPRVDRVVACVPRGRRIAAADLAAPGASSQIERPAVGLRTLHAAGSTRRVDAIDVRTGHGHGSRSPARLDEGRRGRLTHLACVDPLFDVSTS